MPYDAARRTGRGIAKLLVVTRLAMEARIHIHVGSAVDKTIQQLLDGVNKDKQDYPANTGQREQLCHVVAVITINYSLLIDVKSHLCL